jgi:hypothetical protein
LEVRETWGDREEIAQTLADTRNYFTHFGRRSDRVPTTPVELNQLAARLVAILHGIFLSELGLEPSGAFSSAWGQRLLQFAA